MSSIPSADRIVAGLPEAVLVISEQNKIIAMNAAAENLFGTSSKNIIGNMLDHELDSENLRLNEILADKDIELLAHDVEVAIRKQKYVIDIGINSLPPNSNHRVVSMFPKPSPHNLVQERLGGFENIGVSAPEVLGHEIKNPLAAIRGSAQLIARTGSSDSKFHSDLIISEVDRVARLIDRMQDLSSNQPANVEALNIHELIEQTKRSFLQGTEVDIEISSDFDPSLPDVLVDPDAMLQVLTNLFANAKDAVALTENPKIEVSTRYSFGGSYAVGNDLEAPKLPVEIVIMDNGPGIPKELEGQIFAPFVTSKSHGQGLGLALVRKLLSDMKGHIVYNRSEAGQWTQFSVYLPTAAKAKD